MNLSRIVTYIENGIVTISGPALAISGILAGIDLLTGGHLLAQATWLTYAWAITLMLTLDFTVLILGVHARRSYGEKTGWGKAGEVLLAVLVAAAISYVSIQMQSIVARSNAESITIDSAAAQLGISMIALTWERSTLVLFLIFMSGFLRDEGQRSHDTTTDEPLAAPLQEVSISQSTDDAKPLQIPQMTASHFASKEQAIWAALARNPGASDEELAQVCATTVRTASKWAAKHRKEAS